MVRCYRCSVRVTVSPRCLETLAGSCTGGPAVQGQKEPKELRCLGDCGWNRWNNTFEIVEMHWIMLNNTCWNRFKSLEHVETIYCSWRIVMVEKLHQKRPKVLSFRCWFDDFKCPFASFASCVFAQLCVFDCFIRCIVTCFGLWPLGGGQGGAKNLCERSARSALACP